MRFIFSLFAGFGIFMATFMTAAVISGNFYVHCRWYQWVTNGALVAIATVVVYQAIQLR